MKRRDAARGVDAWNSFFGSTILLIVYLTTAIFGLSLAPVSGFAALIWPPAGIALAALFVYGFHLVPSIIIGAFLANWFVGASVPVAMGIAIGNALGTVSAVLMLRRMGFSRSMDSIRDVFTFVIMAAVVSSMISATIGTSFVYFGDTLRESYGATWLAWWFGDLTSVLLLGAALLVWSRGISFKRKLRQSIEVLSSCLLVTFFSVLIFTDWVSSKQEIFFRTYFIFPVLMLVAVRLGQSSVVLANLIVAMIVLYSTVLGDGRFSTSVLSDSSSTHKCFSA
jgi:integral membrane sensor domain MASE1